MVHMVLTGVLVHLAVVDAEAAEHSERLHGADVLVREAVAVLLKRQTSYATVRSQRHAKRPWRYNITKLKHISNCISTMSRTFLKMLGL